MKKKAILSIFLLVAIMLAGSAFSQGTAGNEKDMIQAVAGSMKAFLQEIPQDVLPNYGIRNPQEIDKASAGDPVRAYMPENGQLKFTGTWRVPLVISKEYRALFTVVYDPARGYVIVDFGATVLAAEMYRKKLSSGISGILRVYERSRDFFMSENTKGEVMYTPVPNPENKVYSFDEVIHLVK